ncbi:putative aminopeptidase FrvX [Melghirimyces profundicolus]|uniref:Putative aminopeptidase FrvX n=1 Tax=Melghirimyces profundicolus TaxID=1242148 RepID=A0A2T6BG89_9BACL|nr:M42 family metallopeptidase [Melghirimyces profundicolus]PTX55066.1 putative aminopeptidase FrvX [Melghirimyces profundicolus]
MNWKRFEKLTQLAGVPGAEEEVREALKKEIGHYTKEMVRDRLGSLFGVKRGTKESPRVMVAGHMDEVGFMVTRITDDGFLKFQTLGGWWGQVMLAQRVEVVTRTGKRIPGVIGSVPPHLLKEETRRKPVEIDDMFIDIGADDRQEVEAAGIRPGDSITPVCPLVEMEGGRRLMTKAVDNRFGCAMALELLEDLSDMEHPNVVYSGATVQEEVGLRGAVTAAQTIEPDVFFAVDAGPAGDTPGVKDGFGELGKGVVIRLFDRSMVPLSGMRRFLVETAEEEGIPYQFFVSQGGTDAGAVHKTGTGVPSAAVGVCARYIHSHAAVVDKGDIRAVKRFLTALIRRLDSDRVEQILRG